MAVESSQRGPYLAPPQLMQTRWFTNNDVHMKNAAAGELQDFSFHEKLPQNRLLLTPTLNLPQNHVVSGGRKRSCEQMDVQFGIKVSQELNQFQADSDLLIAEHIKKMKFETELRFKRQMRLIATAFCQKANERIKESEAKLRESNQVNAALHEKALALSMENQLWRNLAKEKEETANTLRDNIVRLIARTRVTLDEVVPDVGDCNSFCGSNDVGGRDVEGDQQEVEMVPAVLSVGGGRGGAGGRTCLCCGRKESCVLLLPCKHLCLCQVCGTALPSACRVCGMECNGSIRVNLC